MSWQSIDDGDTHVVPVDDLIAHEYDEDCVCGPEVEPVSLDDGDFVCWMYTHNSLDGRELIYG